MTKELALADKFISLSRGVHTSTSLTDREKKSLIQFIDDTLAENLSEAYLQKVYSQVVARKMNLEAKNTVNYKLEELTEYLKADDKAKKFKELLDASDRSFSSANSAFRIAYEKGKESGAYPNNMLYFDYLWHELAVSQACYKHWKSKITEGTKND